MTLSKAKIRETIGKVLTNKWGLMNGKEGDLNGYVLQSLVYTDPETAENFLKGKDVLRFYRVVPIKVQTRIGKNANGDKVEVTDWVLDRDRYVKSTCQYSQYSPNTKRKTESTI